MRPATNSSQRFTPRSTATSTSARPSAARNAEGTRLKVLPVTSKPSSAGATTRCQIASCDQGETGMSSQDTIQRSILPIPDAQHVGVTTYDAKDPDTKFPPIEPLRPPKGAPNVLDRAARRRGVRRVERVRRPDPHADRRASGEERPQVQPLPHHRAVLADAPGAADGTQSPLGEHGRHLRDRDRRRPATARCCRRTRRRWR